MPSLRSRDLHGRHYPRESRNAPVLAYALALRVALRRHATARLGEQHVRQRTAPIIDDEEESSDEEIEATAAELAWLEDNIGKMAQLVHDP